MAVLIYLDAGVSSFPTRLPRALADYVGQERADTLRAQVDALLREAGLDPKDWTGDLIADTRTVEDRIRRAHPELSADAVWALGWNFSYANR